MTTETYDNGPSSTSDSSALLPYRDELSLFVRHQPAADNGATRPAVLYVHGATFPSALSVAYPFDGRSWADELAAAGLDVWAFDFLGYGCSSRYPEQFSDPTGVAPLGRADEAADQVVRVLEHVVAERGGGRVSVLAHSWGTIAACLAAVRRPDLVDSLALFGPITRRTTPGLPDPDGLGGWFYLTAQEQYDRFVEDVPAGHPPVLSDAHFAEWAPDWLATDTTSGERTPPSVRVPSGPRADIFAAWSGERAYDPRLIQAPTCILRGEWDSLCTDADARRLLDELTSAPLRRDIKIDAGTHLMHLESGRHALYREAANFLSAQRSRPT
jgi:pimeloyl-ACP methyl ester carboxylesterase